MLATVTELLNLLDLTEMGNDAFEGSQPDPPNHHIVGGQIAAQALLAASKTVAGRRPHSLHLYFLRLGDARYPVHFYVSRLRDGGTFSARRVTAAQGGEVLMEAIASFTRDVDNVEYQDGMPDAPAPETLVRVEQQLAPYAGEFDGWWVRPRAFEMRYVEPPPRIALDRTGSPSSVSRIWLRADGVVPDDEVVNSCVLTYLTALTLLECAMTAMRKAPMGTGVSALLDHAVWFHRRADFSDWLFYDQHSPSGVGGRALATGTVYNRDGGLVCRATQEGYFRKRLSTG